MIYLPNLNDTKGSLQSLLTAINRLEGRVQALTGPRGGGGAEPTMRHGWLGVIRDRGPNDEDPFEVTDPRYWVEAVTASAADGTGPLTTISLTDQDADAAPGGLYVAAANIAECEYLEGGGRVTSSGSANVFTGRLVRVFSLLGAGTFHYFDAGDGLIKCRLDHQGDGVYNAYAWSDPDFETEPLGTALQPEYRPLGTSVGFTQYGETGIGYIDDNNDFVLVLAIEERYDLNPCPDAAP